MIAIRFVIFVSALCMSCYGKAISAEVEIVDSPTPLFQKIGFGAANSFNGNIRLRRSMDEDVKESDDNSDTIDNYGKTYKTKRDIEFGGYQLLKDNMESDDYNAKLLDGGQYVPFFRIRHYFIEKKKV